MRRYAKIDGNYEIIRAVCPWCDARNVFNRRTDLEDFAPISFREVQCQNEICLRTFAINGDTVGPAYRMFYFEGYEFIRQKRYSFCVISSVQSLEVFFAFAVYELWLSRRLLRRTRHAGDLKEFNDAVERLYEKTKNFSYKEMRDLFLFVALSARPRTVAEGRELIEQIPERVKTPTDAALDKAPPTLRQLLRSLKYATVHELRNKVVHKHAYRPSREEAEDAMKTVGDILFPLAKRLRLEHRSL